jgi:hypothetical protein
MLEVMVKADGRQKDYLFLATAAVPDSGTTLFLLSIALGFGLDDDHPNGRRIPLNGVYDLAACHFLRAKFK